MNCLHVRPLVLAVSFALLVACGKGNEASVSVPPPASTVGKTAPAPAPAASSSGFDISEIDTSLHACDDLNGFVNSKWIAANPIPADRTSWGAFDKLEDASLATQHDIVEAAAKHADDSKHGSIDEKIGLIYRSGMDEAAIEQAGIDPIKPQLAKIDALKTTTDIVGFINSSFAAGDAKLFSFGSGADFKDATTVIAYAGQDGLGLPSVDYYLKPEHADIRKQYLAHIAKTLQLAGTSAAEASGQADDILKFETQLAQNSLTPVQLRAVENEYHFVTVQEADQVTPHFKWEFFFAAQGAHVDKGFSLSQPKFFAQLDRMLTATPVAIWRDYFRFHAIDGASPYLSKAFQDNRFDFYGKTLSGQPEQLPRWKRVLRTVNGSMGEALGQLYVARVFTPEAKRRATDLVDNVRLALKARIENVDWMSPETKAKAVEKWGKFLPKIGYPDKWRDWSGLEVKGNDYYGNIQAADRFNYEYDIAKIGKRADRLEWGMTPQTVNAYYNPSDNTINFPAAILQPPFFDANGDEAINYGGIGAVIGHESSHGFDDQGRQFDGDGNNLDWWTAADKTKFEERTAKLVQQFDEYTPLKDKPDQHVNGKLTLGENIADLGGLNVAYDALQTALAKQPGAQDRKIDGYTQDQRFFLNWARVWRENTREKQALLYINTDPHAPSGLRANGAPSNMPAFAAAFQCKPGDAMVRDARRQVRIW